MPRTVRPVDLDLAAFVQMRRGAARVLVRRGYEHAAALLGPGAAASADARLGGGRAAHPIVALPDGTRVLVRRYLRGGLVRHVNRTTYFLGHRAFEELRAMERARGAGVRAPEVLAATERRRGLGYGAWLATRFVEDAEPSDAWLRRTAPDRGSAVLHEIGRQVARLHGAGIAHPDLNLRNLLVRQDSGDTGAPAVWLIDFDRARLYRGAAPERARIRNLHRLARSARKLAAPIDSAGWAALRDGYGAGWPARLGLG